MSYKVHRIYLRCVWTLLLIPFGFLGMRIYDRSGDLASLAIVGAAFLGSVFVTWYAARIVYRISRDDSFWPNTSRRSGWSITKSGNRNGRLLMRERAKQSSGAYHVALSHGIEGDAGRTRKPFDEGPNVVSKTDRR
jgi:hypothetical protein